MNNKINNISIICSKCGKEAFLIREMVYNNSFKKIGEKHICSACKESIDNINDIINKQKDAEKENDVFNKDKLANCHRCIYYVINPFRQWCALNKKDVDALDSCTFFETKEEKEKKEEKG